ncbi:MAG: hypothetical protein CFE33_01890 [Pseudorhodobacter sp. PARRP1]|nr:MAG: hypothetical protein CFE33_01890 [Pseudorhodobacter sp. PARRP1]
MSLSDLLLLQLSDPFRIGLLIALFITMLRTRAASGTVIPLAIGAVFVAVLLPLTAQAGLAVPLAAAIGAGIVANVIWLAIILGAWTLYLRLRA